MRISRIGDAAMHSRSAARGVNVRSQDSLCPLTSGAVAVSRREDKDALSLTLPWSGSTRGEQSCRPSDEHFRVLAFEALARLTLQRSLQRIGPGLTRPFLRRLTLG